jgi:hypothetical protein
MFFARSNGLKNQGASPRFDKNIMEYKGHIKKKADLLAK